MGAPGLRFAPSGSTRASLAESFFSRLRRAEIGIHDHVAGPRESGRAIVDGLWRQLYSTRFPGSGKHVGSAGITVKVA